eukprot:TRINITY_DN2636_c0_g1_i1.p1 TRINITY_DN2636_c0_g1~~TRINITY_DN2636_c0_g1_i1.p1  ORF type:complete len:410 (-),score=117.14 TRINITY_DN2636_c0_g1_i1:285-1463(-)
MPKIVECLNQDLGCDFKGTKMEVIEHFNECQRHACLFEEECKWTGNLKEKEKHVGTQCDFRQVECNFIACDHKEKSIDINSHQSDCKFRELNDVVDQHSQRLNEIQELTKIDNEKTQKRITDSLNVLDSLNNEVGSLNNQIENLTKELTYTQSSLINTNIQAENLQNEIIAINSKIENIYQLVDDKMNQFKEIKRAVIANNNNDLFFDNFVEEEEEEEEVMKTLDWTLNPISKGTNVILENNNLTVKKTLGNNSHSSCTAVGTKEFSFGVHEWICKVTNLQSTSEFGKKDQWCMLGVMPLDTFLKNNSTTTKCYGWTNTGYRANNTNAYDKLEYELTDEYEAHLKLDCNTKVLSVYYPKIDKSFSIPDIILPVVPYVKLYRIGNECEILPKK